MFDLVDRRVASWTRLTSVHVLGSSCTSCINAECHMSLSIFIVRMLILEKEAIPFDGAS